MKGIFCVLALVLFSFPAAAQEAGQVGFTAGFPGSIGIVWQAADAIAIRPDFTFTRTSSESGAVNSLKTSSWAVGFGVSALVYVGKVTENVRTYLSPRFGYARTHADTDPATTTVASGTHGNTYQYGGTFGVQYSPTKRFSVYGEVGVQYAHSNSTFTASTTIPGLTASGTSTSSTFGTRTGVGVVWYFK